MSADTATATPRRPSPRPRPDTGPRLTVVPDPNDSATRNLQPAAEQAPTPEITKPQVNDHPDSANPDADPVQVAGFRTRVSVLWTRAGAYWTPPSIFTDRPASLAELATYAKTAPWTHQDRGVVRGFGVWHYRLLGYPKTVLNRYSEWVWQRPLRLAAHLGGLKLAAATPPGAWIVDHIVYPGAQIAGHLFL